MLTIKHRRSPDIILLRVRAAALDDWDLSEAYLRGADMAGLRCVGTLFRGACLRQADLRDAVLRQADLTDADLAGADLRGADLSRACLDGADLTDALFDPRTRWPHGFGPSAAEHPESQEADPSDTLVERRFLTFPFALRWLAAVP